MKGFHSQFLRKHASTLGNARHQDEQPSTLTRDRSAGTAWIAVEDATIENGCLRFLPGSHRPSVLWPMRPHHNPDLDRAEEAFGFPYTEADAVSCPGTFRGSVVFFSGYVTAFVVPEPHRGRVPAGLAVRLLQHRDAGDVLTPPPTSCWR